MLELSRPVQQALVFLLLVLVFGGGVLYARWQEKPDRETVVVLEQAAEEVPPARQEEPAERKVHVAGAVKRPGVYVFQDRDRVEDVLALAEPLPEADLDALNLAAYLRDEQRIYVPFRRQAGGDSGGSPAVAGGFAGETVRININTAGKEELMTLPGIGPALAERIINYRTGHGPFKSVEELKEVSGIGEKRYQELKDLVTY